MSVISIKNGDASTSSQDEVGVIAGDYATQSYVNTAISDLVVDEVTLTNKTLTSPKMHEIIGDGSVSGGGDRLIFKTLYTGGWSYGPTGPAVNWNTDHITLAWQDPGYDRILVWQLATEQIKNIFRIDAHNKDSVNGNGFIGTKSVNAGSFEDGTKYKITSTGDTDFEDIGAASDAVHTVFTATGAGSGTGTADKWDSGAHNVAFTLKGADNIGFVNAGDFVTSRNYTIKAINDGKDPVGADTDFTAIGAADNNVGTTFTATGAGSGTGVAIDLRPNEGEWSSFTAHTASQSAPGWQTNLDINGNKIRFHQEYVFPTTDGSAAQVLTTDGSGQLSWAAPETITLATLKTEVAASINFADFQSRIAAL